MRYYQQVLTLEINPGITTRESDFETCFRRENVKLAPGGYFGVSAATGALAGKAGSSLFICLLEKLELRNCLMLVIQDINQNIGLIFF